MTGITTTMDFRPTAMLAALAGKLPTISLDEINKTAELQVRVDRKYALNTSEYPEALPAIFAVLPAGTRAQCIAGEIQGNYASTYFDTPDLTSYLLTAHRRRRRFKVRHRDYLDTGFGVVEVKTRGPRGLTVKDRIPLDDELETDESDLVRGILSQRIGYVPRAGLEPSLETTYRRTTLALPDGIGRVTLDSDLVWALPGDRGATVPDLVIIETKQGAQAGPVDHALWRLGVRPVHLSKYGTGLAVLRPELPSNRWHSTLDRHIAGRLVAA